MCFDTAVKYHPSRSWLNGAFFILCLFIITACGGGGEEVPAEENPEAAPPPPSKIICNETCRIEGQCGDNAEGQPVILGRDDRPETREHTQLFPHDADVNILNSQEKIVRRPTTNEDFNLLFYQVQLTGENAQAGWVASWCIAQP